MASETKGPWRVGFDVLWGTTDVRDADGEVIARMRPCCGEDALAAHIVACVNGAAANMECMRALATAADTARTRADALAAENERLRVALITLCMVVEDMPNDEELEGEQDSTFEFYASEAARARAALAGKGDTVGCHKCRTWADVTDRKPHAAQAAINCSNCGTNVGQVWESMHGVR